MLSDPIGLVVPIPTLPEELILNRVLVPTTLLSQISNVLPFVPNAKVFADEANCI